MRALQKAVAEELELPQSVMAIFERCDQEDDFNGIEEGSRGVIAEISREICRKLLSSVVDLACEVRDCAYLILEDGEKGKMKSQSDILLSASPNNVELPEFLDLVRDLLHEDALEVAKCAGIVQPDDMSHKIVMECLIYRTLIAMDLKTHAPNYWVCDGIIQDQDNASAWEIGNSLERNMSSYWNFPYNEDTASVLQVSDDFLVNRWNFTTHEQLLKDYTRVLPPQVTSFFLSEDEPPTNTTSILPVRMFQYSQSSKLRVLHLSHCIFSFASPPFLCCSQLRLLHLDHCKNITDDHEHPSHNENMPCFQKLWVLDLRENEVIGPVLISSTNRLMTHLESFSFMNTAGIAAKISSISFRGCSRLKSILLRGNLGRLVELDLSGTTVKTLDLREVEVPYLRSVILMGCEKLYAILWPLEGKTRWILEKLHISTIRYASPSKKNWEENTKEASAGGGCSSILNFGASPQGTSGTTSFEFNWYISVVDTRLMCSLVPFQRHIEKHSVYMEIDSSSTCGVAIGGRDVSQGMGSQQIAQYSYASDLFREDPKSVSAMEGISWMWACPPNPTPSPQDWYFHMQDEEKMDRGSLQRQRNNTQRISTGIALAPVLMCDSARMLYVHDSASTTCIPCPPDSGWNNLGWCRVERCPSLCSVFTIPQLKYSGNTFVHLHTFWASQLLKACYIWNWSIIAQGEQSFQHLVFLHLDCCPRLRYVLPLPERMHCYVLSSLETLEIVCCGDLKEIFPLDPKRQENQQIIYFDNLRRIHLYELPMLHHICGSRMSAPKLETVKIRGCWSLRLLPAVRVHTSKRPKVDCEKEWWDNLEWLNWQGRYWDRRKYYWAEIKHDPSLYELSHSRYYKKADLPRGTVLR
ncbi:hypothetical protein D1007_55284 [Hordeum vulgare]|nr:hypothetical protein D1007_55284 [Hordeum vulgare]